MYKILLSEKKHLPLASLGKTKSKLFLFLTVSFFYGINICQFLLKPLFRRIGKSRPTSRHRTSAGSGVAQRVVLALVHAAAVGDADGAARGGAAGAVGVCHVVACHVAITFSISRVQRANHAVFALCRGEKMSCNNAFLTACSMCSRNLFRPEGWSPWSDCPRGRRCSGSRRHRDGCVSSSCRTGHIRRPWESLRGRRWRQAARGCRNASA